MRVSLIAFPQICFSKNMRLKSPLENSSGLVLNCSVYTTLYALHRYVLTVATSKICSIQRLRPEPTKKPKEIKCSPALTDSEYEKYLQYEKGKRSFPI